MPKHQNKILLTIIIVFSFTAGNSQNINLKNDICQIKNHLAGELPRNEKRSWIYSRDGDKKKHVNPAAILLGGSLYIYQNVISKHLSADCLFSPSCSEFSKQSIREFGVVKGILSSIDRVNRCNRIAEHDLKNFSRNPLTNRYNDPVSRYRKGKGDDSV